MNREDSWKIEARAQGFGDDLFAATANDAAQGASQQEHATFGSSAAAARNPELEERSRLAREEAYKKVLEKTGFDPNEEKKKSTSRRSLTKEKSSVLDDSDDDDDDDDEEKRRRSLTGPKKYPPPKGYGPTITWEKPKFETDRGAFEPMRKPPRFDFDVEFEESMPPDKMMGVVVDGVLSEEDALDGTFHVSKCTNCKKKLRVKKMALLLECPDPACKHVMPNTTTALS